MSNKILRISDYDRKSRNPDAVSPRDPCDATIIILPVVCPERYEEDEDVKVSGS
jgi:hypothetical protein